VGHDEDVYKQINIEEVKATKFVEFYGITFKAEYMTFHEGNNGAEFMQISKILNIRNHYLFECQILEGFVFNVNIRAYLQVFGT
jgi:hypothetical protein